MRVDALAIRLRPRSAMEAADLGVRLCQSSAADVYRCYALVALPLFAFAVATVQIADWLPGILIWTAKPWLDRTILFVLSRAAFGQRTTVADLWKAQRRVWWRGAWFSWTVRRLSPWRALTEPVYQLEGVPISQAGARVRQLRRGKSGTAFMMTQAFALSELSLNLGLLSLMFWFAPEGYTPDLLDLLTSEIPLYLAIGLPVTFAATVLFLEPFYVAAGFSMYLHRRAELEAWDIEQEFRRVFPPRVVPAAAALLLIACVAAPVVHAEPTNVRTPLSEEEVASALEAVRADPNLAEDRMIKTLRWKEPGKARSTPDSLKWIAGLFAWVAQSTRALIWIAAALLLGVAAVLLARMLRDRPGALSADDDFVAPTHVGEIDIRPETLPADPGMAVRALWEGGERRGALALLYRALLSRLAHRHRVPIRDSSTEGDCLALAASHLIAGRREYAEQVVLLWQQFVYAGHDVQSASVHALCDNFGPILDRGDGADPTASGGVA